MDITSIKRIILDNLKQLLNVKLLWAKMKEALKLPYAKTYVVLALVMTMVFCVFTFPYDMLLRKQMKSLEKTLFRSIHVSEIDFSLIDIIVLNNVYAVLRSGSEITIRNADIDISLFRLLLAKDIKGTIQLQNFKYESESSKIAFNLNGNIYIDYKSFDDMPQGGEFNIIIDNMSLNIGQFTLPDTMGGLPLNLPPIKISSIKAEAEISNKKILIKNIRIFGKDLNGTITGSIDMAKIFWSSRLDLKLTMDANTPILDGYRDFISKYVNDSNQLVIPLKGSLVAPRIDFMHTDTSSPQPGPEHPMDKILPVP
jgi:hypothetical protein